MKGLYPHTLKDDFLRLAPVLQALHGAPDVRVYGALDIDWTAHPWLRLILRLAGMPRPAVAAPCSVRLYAVAPACEGWVRRIGQQMMVSVMEAGAPSVIVERVGPVSVPLFTWVDAESHLHQRSECVKLRWLGWKVPGLLITASEHAIDERRFHCRVEVSFARFGTVLSYNGVLRVLGAPNISTERENP